MILRLLTSAYILILIVVLSGCKKEEKTVTDIDGNTYRTITVGGKVWMAQDLRTTRFNDGSDISYVQGGTQWANLTAAAFAEVNNSSSNAAIYGRLYNWYAVADSRKLCPAGWHVPSAEEYADFISKFDSEDKAGGHMKETGTEYWLSPNVEATNLSGFSARGAGYVNYQGVYKDFKYVTGFWTSTAADATYAYYVGLWSADPWCDQTAANKKTGFQVRCVKD